MKPDEEQLLPWYINDSLSEEERKRVEAWLAGSPEARRHLARMQKMVLAIRQQPQSAPSSQFQERLIEQLQQVEPGAQAPAQSRLESPRLGLVWVWGALLSALCVLVLWAVLQPGIVLNWSVKGLPQGDFKIYRADRDRLEFSLVAEVPALPGEHMYTYVDPFLVPGAEYVYRVETVDVAGSGVSSQVVAQGAGRVVGVQILILLISLLAGYAGARWIAGSRGPAFSGLAMRMV